MNTKQGGVLSAFFRRMGSDVVYDSREFKSDLGKCEKDGTFTSSLPKAKPSPQNNTELLGTPTPHPSNNTELLGTPIARSIAERLEQYTKQPPATAGGSTRGARDAVWISIMPNPRFEGDTIC